MKRSPAVLLSACLLGACLPSAAPVLAYGTPTRSLSTVYLMVLENHSLSSTIGNPDLPVLNRLARTYGYAANYTGVAHPSLPNYVAMIAGSTMNMTSDDPSQRFAGDSLPIQLTRAGLTWRAYLQGLPTDGSTADYAGLYGKKHNPFMLSQSVLGSGQQLSNVRTLAGLGLDLQAGRTANFNFIVPDLCHDMHGAPECRSRPALDHAGDAFVDTWTKRIMASPSWKAGAAIVITFDEGGGGDTVGGGGRVATIVVTPDGPRGTVSRVQYNHYSLLRTLQDGFGLPPLRQAQLATPMADLFWKISGK